MAGWVDRERRTGQIVRACYEHYLQGAPKADKLHALCRLTWITKGGDNDADLPDNTPSVVVPALRTLTGVDLRAENPPQLAKALRRAGVPEDVVRPASRPVGFTNFYAGFRNIARDWIEANKLAVLPIIRAVADAAHDDDARGAYARVEQLPPLPRPGAGDMPAFNLLTPLLACLDRRGRAPIINSRKAVKHRLSMLGLSNASLSQQFDGLTNLIGQAGIIDTFALDTAADDHIARAMKAKSASPKRSSKKKPAPKPLGDRCDEDVKYLRSADTVAMRRVHNRMTNALRSICAAVPLMVEEGSDREYLFDALIRDYDGERHLLVEVKADSNPATCRLAVGQLLDYRRRLPGRAAIDLAVLVPEEPPKSAVQFFGYVGVKVMWFDMAMEAVRGQVRLRAVRK
jgi:hypothetical protein